MLWPIVCRFTAIIVSAANGHKGGHDHVGEAIMDAFGGILHQPGSHPSAAAKDRMVPDGTQGCDHAAFSTFIKGDGDGRSNARGRTT